MSVEKGKAIGAACLHQKAQCWGSHACTALPGRAFSEHDKVRHRPGLPWSRLMRGDARTAPAAGSFVHAQQKVLHAGRDGTRCVSQLGDLSFHPGNDHCMHRGRWRGVNGGTVRETQVPSNLEVPVLEEE
eukprot:428897-Pelagomonas_calceolata.AAC.2